MRYEVLGPLRVLDGDQVSTISAPKIEIVMTVLLVRSDQVVTLEQLMAEIWGDQLPRRATAGVHVYISQLRKFLSRPERPDSPVVTRPSGYLLRKGSDELDLHIFLQSVEEGRGHFRDQRYEQAVACLDQALAQWRGPLAGDLRAGRIIDGFAAWLAETRLECLEMLMESQLHMGRHREIVGRLYSLTLEHPLREAFYRQLMLALYRSERQADALRVYQGARAMLNEELGLEPCRGLQALNRAILVADPQLDDHVALI
ncbi:AfsR/SARP family transcriptional regulator [Micromonospora eburnea]|uniref:DNA-binding transcriptional activator of the SARP family n=1 Tax=Micromonospora eburnea TaxID=227316 RepID=A0A1C6V192_9ACTN|nr:AfsR/SARP family transcriptional regulator [Micromonospora eburnea]SCL59894.1 DNA-binding transcriptional activator of the SARP family [Micromonospora eburnea]